MAKKQNFVVGSTNPVTVTKTQAELNNGWNKYQVLKAGDLDGVFNAVSDYSNDSSQEIWNAIRILKGSNPTGASTNELGNIISSVLGEKATKSTDFMTALTSDNKGATAADLNTLREEIETSSLTFKGYVATSAPSSSTYGLVEGNIWINASEMPTTFPVAIAGIWNGTSWATTTETYTVQDFDFFRNINDNEGYYWFGGQWTVMSTDMSTTYFTLNQTSGKWEIKSSVNLPGNPTTTTPAAGDNSTNIATTKFVADSFAPLASPALTGTPTAPTPTSSSIDDQIATKKYVDEAIAPLPTTTYFPDLFDWKWADHICNDASWLRADTFSWQSGAVYEAGYNHLVDDLENIPQQEWAVSTQNANLSVNNPDWCGIAYNGSKFVALSLIGEISTSTDGTTWTTASQNANLGNNVWKRIASNGTKFVALGSAGYISTSTDGTTWATATQNANLNSVIGLGFWNGLVFDGTKFIALNSGGYISTSTDGTTWTTPVQNANLGSHGWQQIAYDGTKYVALGIWGYISTSEDGTNWATATQNADLGSNEWLGLATSGTEFVAVSYNGYTSKSVDGINWTEAVIDTNLGNHNWAAIVNDNSKFIALAWYGWISTKSNDSQTETIAGTTITYYTAEDGHKIVLPNQESKVSAIYAATGVAWYYILDTINQRFKLPRTKYGFTGLRDTVGKYVEAGLPNITGSFNFDKPFCNGATASGAIKTSTAQIRRHVDGADSTGGGFTFDASRSSSIYGNSTTVQPPATQMYLYFYVGNFTQTALENTAGVVTEDFNELNAHKVIAFQAPTAANNYTWCRKYADGWVEQGGVVSVAQFTLGAGSTTTVGTVTFPVEVTKITGLSFGDDMVFCNLHARDESGTGMTIKASNQLAVSYTQNACEIFWQVSGIAA